MVLVATGAAAFPGVAAGPGVAAPPAGSTASITGMFSHLADAARITLCADGRSLPVAMEGDFRALESAYRAARVQPGQALLVVVQGHVTQRPAAEWRRPPELTLVVDRFEQVRPRETCAQAQADSALRGTTWRLLQLDGRPVDGGARQGEPQLTISADGARFSGHGGCNRMSGPVQIRGDRIAFGQIVSTRMACATGQQQESAFFDALERSERWQISGNRLELRDARGRVLARLEAAAPR
jgi:heat shock protein HslJ